MSNEREYVVDGIPFYSQRLSVEENPGLSQGDAAYWSLRACGVACVKMLLAGADNHMGKSDSTSKSMWELIGEGLHEKAYCDRGWIHAGLLKLLSKYGISGECHRQTSITKMAEIIQRGNVCIASVSVGLSGGEKDEKGNVVGKGGHLILFHGVKKNESGIVSLRCHHPSSYLSWNWENLWVAKEKVEKSFSGNLIEIDWQGFLKQNPSPSFPSATERNGALIKRDF